MTLLAAGLLVIGWVLLIASGYTGWVWAAVLAALASWCFGFAMGVYTYHIVRGEATWRKLK